MATRGDRGGNDGGDAARSAEYIADLTKELAVIARGSRLDMLAYLLDIAHLEASERAGRDATAVVSQIARPVRG